MFKTTLFLILLTKIANAGVILHEERTNLLNNTSEIITDINSTNIKFHYLKTLPTFQKLRKNVAIFILPVVKTGNLKDTVNRFPPFLEHFVQLIQRYFSNYVHEDLSRPPSWNSPNFGQNDPQFLVQQKN